MERKEQSGAKRTVIQFVKFNIVGVLNTLVDFLVFQALNLLLGVAAYPIMTLITQGFQMIS